MKENDERGMVNDEEKQESEARSQNGETESRFYSFISSGS
jgi:hypothetical protein